MIHTMFSSCTSGKEHSMRALSKAFLLSLIQNEDTLTVTLTLVWMRTKAPCFPPLPAIRNEVTVYMQRLKVHRPQEPQEDLFPSLKELPQLHNLQTQGKRGEVHSLRLYASACFSSLLCSAPCCLLPPYYSLTS